MRKRKYPDRSLRMHGASPDCKNCVATEPQYRPCSRCRDRFWKKTERMEARFDAVLKPLNIAMGPYSLGSYRRHWSTGDYRIVVALASGVWLLKFGSYGHYLKFRGKGPAALRRRVSFLQKFECHRDNPTWFGAKVTGRVLPKTKVVA